MIPFPIYFAPQLCAICLVLVEVQDAIGVEELAFERGHDVPRWVHADPEVCKANLA